MDFDQLGERWQQQKLPQQDEKQARESSSRDDLLTSLRKIQTQTIFAGLGVSVSFAVVFIVLGWMYQMTLPAAWYFHLGMFFMAVAMIGVLIFIWSMVFAYSNRSVSLDSQSFLKGVEKKLKRQEVMINRGMLLYLFVLLLGLNCIFLEVLAEVSILFRIIIHVMTTSLTVMFYVFSIPYFSRKSETRIEPVLKEVQALLKNWDTKDDEES